MEIVPNSTLYILKNVPLDKTYDHTIYFANKAAQEAAFIAKKKFKCGVQGDLSALTYVRVNRGVIRVGIPSEQLYDCNYLMFQNKGFQQSGQNDRWFYAFIESVEYINNKTSEIRFSIDVMQTWYFDYTVEDCFVVREHSATDVVGDNTLEEPFAIGDYVADNYETTGLFRDYVVCLAKAANTINVPAIGGIYGNRIYHSVDIATYELNATGIGQLRTDLTGMEIFSSDKYILNIFMCPRGLIQNANQALKTFNVSAPVRGTHYGEDSSDKYYYNPRNKKLLTYPYCFLRVNNLQGTTIDYKYERFNSQTPTFVGFSETTVTPSFVLIPEGYLDNNNVASPQSVISINQFPMCGWATTDFAPKVVQAGIAVAGGVVAGVAGAKAASATSHAGAMNRGLQNAQEMFDRFEIGTQELYKWKDRADEASKDLASALETKDAVAVANTIGDYISNSIGVGGHISTSVPPINSMFMGGYFDIMMSKMHITPEYAKIMDDYFDRFGYTCKRVKRPNTHVRKHWTYTQTANCTIAGSMPADDEAKICSIYNSGVTFWNNMNEVGEYTTYARDNTPL